MEPSFWHQRWERNEIAFHQGQINVHLQQHWPALGLRPDTQVFVPLCGKSRDMLWLRAQGHSVLGVELSPLAVRNFFAENELHPTLTSEGRLERWENDRLALLCGDFFNLEAGHLAHAEAVYDRASLIALPPRTRVNYTRQLADLLQPGTPGLLVTMEYPQEQMNGPPFSVLEKEVQGLLGAAFDIETLYRTDILAEHPRFRDKGLTQLVERIYRIRRAG